MDEKEGMAVITFLEPTGTHESDPFMEVVSAAYNPQPGTTSAGWSCPNCQGWVPSGEWHNCPWEQQPGIITYRTGPPPDLSALEQKMDKIIGLLEQILRRM
jgi:hypothetical protein